MIGNVIGKAVTKSTLIGLPEYDGDREIRGEDLARVALALKNSQGKGKDEEEALRHVERLRDACAHEQSRFTLGWIYNASGGAITLIDSRDWQGELASSNPYPVRIENGQWGVFLHKQSLSLSSGVSSGAVVYQGADRYRTPCYWCVAWKNEPRSSAQVHSLNLLPSNTFLKLDDSSPNPPNLCVNYKF